MRINRVWGSSFSTVHLNWVLCPDVKHRRPVYHMGARKEEDVSSSQRLVLDVLDLSVWPRGNLEGFLGFARPMPVHLLMEM